MSLLERFAEFSPELREEEPTDWEQVTRDAWPPLCVGERFYLVAPWDETAPTPPGRLRLEIYPGMACGTGRHPATQLCLQAIERYVKPGTRVLDVGSGSGILSDAARLVGAGCVVGCDIDPDAVRIARERVRVPMFVGSADAVRSAMGRRDRGQYRRRHVGADGAGVGARAQAGIDPDTVRLPGLGPSRRVRAL